ncbi:MAG: fibro-slime domain-containing protein [Phycisphaerales bacterium]|nr:fibro-slime domain-containing protein [Phycisphaerales bacterium]
MNDLKKAMAFITTAGLTISALALAAATSSEAPTVGDVAIEQGQVEAGKLPGKMRIAAVTRDFQAYHLANGHPDFEQYNTGARLGLVNALLDQDGKPTLASSSGMKVSTPYRDADGRPIYPGVYDTARGDVLGVLSPVTDQAVTNEDSFRQWYRDVPGINTSKALEITLERVPGTNRYVFDSDVAEPWASRGGFFPWDKDGFGDYGSTGHNFHFTTELDTEFVFERDKGHVFTFTGDDDVWVFIDGQLVIDLSGVHGEVEQTVALDRLAWLEDGHVYTLKVFHAERHTTKSNFRIETTLRLRSVKLPNTYKPYD